MQEMKEMKLQRKKREKCNVDVEPTRRDHVWVTFRFRIEHDRSRATF